MLKEVDDFSHRCQEAEISNGLTTHNCLMSIFLISPLGAFLSFSPHPPLFFSAHVVLFISLSLSLMSTLLVALKDKELSCS